MKTKHEKQKQTKKKLLESEKEIDTVRNVKPIVEKKLKNSLKVVESSKRKLKVNSKENNTKKLKASTEWIVTSLDEDTAVENIFDDLEEKIKDKVLKKSQNLLKSESKKQTKLKKPRKEKKQKKIDLSIPRPATRPIIDEELLEQPGRVTENSLAADKELEVLENVLKATSNLEAKASPASVVEKPINTKPISLNTELPELLTIEENEDDNTDNFDGIPEAFEDDDAVEDFDKEKAETIEKSKPKDIDLTLPGWGSWGGKNLKVPKKKRKRFIIKFPQQTKRNDMNKGRVIINEDGNDKIRPHQVSEVPFPFKTVKDFEASIRAPIGSTFVPEVPHRRMIRPAVKTLMGTIIEPMSEEVLLKKALKGLPVVK